jgi:hypothetical protein
MPAEDRLRPATHDFAACIEAKAWAAGPPPTVPARSGAWAFAAMPIGRPALPQWVPGADAARACAVPPIVVLRRIGAWAFGRMRHGARRQPGDNRRGRTAGHGVSPTGERPGGSDPPSRPAPQGAGGSGCGIATAQPGRPVRRAAAQASKRLTRMQKGWTPMHADRTWTTAPVRLIRIAGRVQPCSITPDSGPSACIGVHPFCICVKTLACFAACGTVPSSRGTTGHRTGSRQCACCCTDCATPTATVATCVATASKRQRSAGGASRLDDALAWTGHLARAVDRQWHARRPVS